MLTRLVNIPGPITLIIPIGHVPGRFSAGSQSRACSRLVILVATPALAILVAAPDAPVPQVVPTKTGMPGGVTIPATPILPGASPAALAPSDPAPSLALAAGAPAFGGGVR